MSFSNGGLPSHRREDYQRKKETRHNKWYCSCQNFIPSWISSLCASVYVNTNHPHKDTHTQIHHHRKKHTTALTDSTIPPIKDVGKAVRLPQSETSLFIYLQEFRVITGITAALGCDISLKSQVRGAPSGDMPGRKCDSFPPLISNQIK